MLKINNIGTSKVAPMFYEKSTSTKNYGCCDSKKFRNRFEKIVAGALSVNAMQHDILNEKYVIKFY